MRYNLNKKEYYRKVSELGCIICSMPAEIHHLTGAGMGLKSKDDEIMPLCPNHHRLGSFGNAVHNGTQTFEDRYGTQRELIELTKLKLKQEEDNYLI